MEGERREVWQGVYAAERWLAGVMKETTANPGSVGEFQSALGTSELPV